MRVLSMNFDGTYTITKMDGMNAADLWAESHVNQLHFIQHRNGDRVVQWVGPNNGTMRWYEPINPVEAKTAMLLFTLEV